MGRCFRGMGKGERPMGASAHAPIPEGEVGRLGEGEDYQRKIYLVYQEGVAKIP